MTDKDTDKKLKKMEEQLDVITSSLVSRTLDSRFSSPDSRASVIGRSDEIGLLELFSILWRGKWWIMGVAFLFAVAGVAYALSLPNMYKSTGIYASAKKESGGAVMSGQLGGLASLAGVDLGGGESSDIDQAMVIVKSWPFLEDLAEENDLAPLVLAVKGWDREEGEILWNHEVYNPKNKEWLGEDSLVSPGPSSYEVYRALNQMIEASVNAKTGMVAVSVTHYSPVIAERWVRLLINALNAYFKERDIVDARRNIDYLDKRIDQTQIAQMQSVFYRMIESQMKTLMLAEIGEAYLLNEVVPPKVAERKSKPAKAIICILFAIVGGLLSSLAVLIRGVLLKSSEGV